MENWLGFRFLPRCIYAGAVLAMSEMPVCQTRELCVFSRVFLKTRFSSFQN